MATKRCHWCGIGFGPGESPRRAPGDPDIITSVYHAVCLPKMRRAENRVARKILAAINRAVFVDRRKGES